MNKFYFNIRKNSVLPLWSSKSIGLFLMVLFVGFTSFVNAQCSITSSTNASAITCSGSPSTSPLGSCGILYIGDGTTSMSLAMSADLNLTCLGPIQFIVRNNAKIDFAAGSNKNLTLAAGSSIQFQPGSSLDGGTSCGASDLIYIGTQKVASCNGNGGAQMSFSSLVTNGYSPVTASASPSSICNSGSPTITATANPSSGATYKWYTAASGGTLLYTGNPYYPGTISSTTTYYVDASYTTPTYTTVRTAVTVIVNPSPATPGAITGSVTQCAGNTSQVYSVTPVANATSYNWTLPANWSIASGAGTNSITVNIASNGATNNVSVNATNSCGTSASVYQYVAVSTPTVSGTVTPANTNVCSGSNSTNLYLSGNTGSIVRWESSLDNFAGGTITTIASTGSPITASGLTVDTYYRAVVQSGGCNLLYSNSVKITVYGTVANPGGISMNGVAYPVNGNTTYCASTNVVFSIAAVTNATTYTWAVPTGWTLISGQGTTTATYTTGNSSQSNNVSVSASNSSICNSPGSVYLWVGLSTSPTATPTVTLTQPTCTVGGTITVNTPAPATGITYTVTGTSPVVAAVTNTTGVFSGLAVGNYNVTTTNTICGVSPITSVTLTSLVTKTWNGSWSPAGAPTNNNLVIIAANYSASSNGDLNACSVVINSGYKLTVEAGKFVIIQNDLTVNGTLDVLDKGSLVMVNDAGVVTNSGVTNIHRFTTPFKLYDYTYWSTPVVSTSIATTFPTWITSNAYEYLPANFFDGDGDNIDDDENDWSFTSTMAPAKGYIIMTPVPVSGPFGNNPSEIVFNGIVNNGIQKVTGVIPESTYLVGNPYPSALDADAFLSYNSGVIDGTLYFWTHNTAIQLASNIAAGKSGSGIYAYTSDDYASYNSVGGTATAPAISGGVTPSGKIASCQGFFTTTNATIVGTNEIVFNNSMRLTPGGATLSNAQFFKTKKPKGHIEKNRIWLNLSNDEGAFKQTLLGYVTDATNENENRFDGESFDGNEFVDFYSINQDKNLAIQGRALPFDDNDEVPLGYRSEIDGDFTITIDNVDGSLSNQDVFLEDKLTNTISDLKAGKYTFKTEAGTFDDRFVLKYKNTDKTLGTGDFDTSTHPVVVSIKNKQIKIDAFAETIDKVLVFDLTGKLIYQKNKINSNELLMTDFNSSHQTLIVKTTLQNGKTVADKVVY